MSAQRVDDEMGVQCRQITKAGKRCSRRGQWLLTYCVSRESWLAALRTGWPRMVRGMREPDWAKFSLCRQHGNDYPSMYGDDKKPRPKLFGLGDFKAQLDAEYEAAKVEGDAACARNFP